ncbi:MAG: RidA family protein [Oscillospiraceae bacterium]|nr:RidA family protein [Oscillospiraceae bacterium]
MRIVSTDAAPSAIGPYSQAIVQNGIVYTSGQIPLLPSTGEFAGGNISEQAEQAIKNLAMVLVAAGSSLDRVIKTTCYLTNMGDFDAFNAVYARYFTGKPARSCVAALALPRGAAVEIEAVALVIE